MPESELNNTYLKKMGTKNCAFKKEMKLLFKQRDFSSSYCNEQFYCNLIILQKI